MNDPRKQTIQQYLREAPIMFWVTFGVAFFCGGLSALAGTASVDGLATVFPSIDTVYYDLQPFRFGLTILSFVLLGSASIGPALLFIHHLHCVWLDDNQKKATESGKDTE